jgi:hypothetical protein
VATSSPPPAPGPSLVHRTSRSLSAADLCVTSGSLGASGSDLSVESPEFRAVVASASDANAELRFTYLGPTAEVARLGSGRVRTQIGMKMLAKDPCNLVYAMWRIDPGPELAVQVKRNAGQSTSAECKNRGYRTIRPARSAPMPEVAPGSSHLLRAEIDEFELSVWADDLLVWQGELGDDVQDLWGPVGLRSDNARFAFAFDVRSGSPSGPRRCGKSSPEEE